jgi:TRAP-type C4-dicarboxylate transport system permease small subunit
VAQAPGRGRAGLAGLARRVITLWALLGGLVLLAVVLVNAASILGAALFIAPVPGDFELTEMGMAVAVFCFLPYAQLTRSNVTADIFTSGASARWIARFGLLASAVALGFSLFLGWRMYFGLLDQRAYGYTTAILQIPEWIAFVPILISLMLTAVAALITLTEDAAEA